jgi:acetyl esterase
MRCHSVPGMAWWHISDGGARGLSKASKSIVVSVDYRLAPEAKFPAAWDDALAAYKYVAKNAYKMHGDPSKLAIAGESAGGNLAVSTAVSALAAGLPAPKAVIAVYPVTQTGSMTTPSYVDSADAKPLNKAMIGWFVDKLFANPSDKSDPRVDIVHAKLAGLPPVTIINAEIDPLRSDGDLLEQSLTQAGVKVDHKVYKGVTHEFFGTAAVVGDAKKAQGFAGDQLKSAFK